MVSGSLSGTGADRIRPRCTRSGGVQHGDRKVAGHHIRDSGRARHPVWWQSAFAGNPAVRLKPPSFFKPESGPARRNLD
ncbi:hypothetical protein RCIA8 [Methanocella arvoryzae MRE50]|uniref:Uncharacterized protein n=1 Tax=Methanocella arvoryzae (strain DSM 22066 / NBRC 105507 / MRE50) TaxID=351160 RepID=Q0W7H5_METAR|nr:hypothetical protein RCIA8 [Methanocella arvoryzae MRE50]